jgi:hypothetical protein
MRKAAPSRKSMNKKIKWALVVTVLGMTVAAALFLRPRDAVSLEAYQKIRLGMSRRAVESLLGGAGLNYDSVMTHLKDRKEIRWAEVELYEPAESDIDVKDKRQRWWLGRHAHLPRI